MRADVGSHPKASKGVTPIADVAELGIKVKFDDVGRATVSLNQLTAAGDRAEKATSNLGGAASRAKPHMSGWAALNDQAARHVGEHTLGIGRMERSLEQFASHALGVNHTVGLLATTMAKFALGSIETGGILLGIAAIAAAYEKITEAARDARKAQEDMLKAAREANYAAGPGGSDPARQYGLQLQQYHDLEKRRSMLETYGQSTAQIDVQLKGALIQLNDTWRRLKLGTLPTVTTDARSQEELTRDAVAASLQASKDYWRDQSALFRHAREYLLDLQRDLKEWAYETRNDVADSVGKEIVGGINVSMPSVGINAGLTRHQIAMRRRMGINVDEPTDVGSGVLSALNQFSPANLAASVVGGLINTAVGGFASMLQSTKAMAEQFRRMQRELKLSMDAFHAAAIGDTLESALASQRASYESLLNQINALYGFPSAGSGLPGSREVGTTRQRELDKAARDEAAAEARIRAQHAHDAQYGLEDLAVRNLRALGRGDEAGLLAFREQQQREMQRAIDENRDALYINNLRTTQNNELLAYLNGTLQDAARNAPTGFFANSYYSEFATPRGYPTDGGINPALPYTGKGSPSNPVTIILQVDGKVLTRTVVNGLDQKAGQIGGSGSSRAQALEAY